MATYTEKLKHPLWQKKRLKIFERDSFKCRSCNSVDKPLHVHHTFYMDIPNPWDYADDMLLTLCEDCHQKELDRHNLERHLSATFRLNDFLYSDLVALSSLLDTDEDFKNRLLKILRAFQNG